MNSIPNIQILIAHSSREELAKRYIELYIDNLSRTNNLEEALRELHGKDEEIQKLKDRISLLEKRPKKPKINDSKRSSSSSSRGNVCKDAKKKRKKSGKGKSKSELSINKTLILEPDNIPEDAVFNGYKPYLVQDIKITTFNTLYKRAVYILPNGKTLTADLPASVQGSHFGTELRSFILNEYHTKRVTQPLIHNFLQDTGIVISQAQINNILNSKISDFEKEYNDILLTGLLYSYYLHVDDTGSIHSGKNGYCTVIGNEAFAWYKSTNSKSRVNFLELLSTPCGPCKYIFNNAASRYLKKYKIKLSRLNDLSFTTKADLIYYLEFYGIKGVNKFKRIEEAGLIGAIDTLKSVESLYIMSDNAKQFNLFNHMQCWVHMERNIKKYKPTNQTFIQEQNLVLDLFWDIFKNIKDYKNTGNIKNKELAEEKFKTLSLLSIQYEYLKDQVDFIVLNKKEFLMSLYDPVLPLHNNLCENDIRQYVMKRNISGETKSEDGKKARDIFLSIKTTCRKCGINFIDYLKNKLEKTNKFPSISSLVREAIKLHNIQSQISTC